MGCFSLTSLRARELFPWTAGPGTHKGLCRPCDPGCRISEIAAPLPRNYAAQAKAQAPKMGSPLRLHFSSQHVRKLLLLRARLPVRRVLRTRLRRCLPPSSTPPPTPPSLSAPADALACTPPAVLAVLTELVLMVLAALPVLS